jgi:hypothetical protein
MRGNGGFLNGIVTMVLVSVVIVWGVTSLTNGDPLWFLHRFDAQAESMTLHWDGEVYVVTPEDPGYDALMEAFSNAVASPAGFEWSVAFSEDNIERYRERFRLLEVRFAEPVQVHTRHPFLEAATYLVPLSEHHGNARRVFAFPGRVPYTSGPINMSQAAAESLYEAAEYAVRAAESSVKAGESAVRVQ